MKTKTQSPEATIAQMEEQLRVEKFCFCREITERQKDGLERIFSMYKNFSTFKSAIIYTEEKNGCIETATIFYQK